MCGIFGFFVSSEAAKRGLSRQADEISRRLNLLYSLSETRGKEAAGIAAARGAHIKIHKTSSPASQMIASPAYQTLLTARLSATATNAGNGLAVLGHTRLVTNGLQVIDANNQPAKSEHVVGVHNGIIINDAELWDAHPALSRTSELDTQVLIDMIDLYRTEQATQAAVETAMTQVRGETSAAFLFTDEDTLALTTNTGSLYVVINPHSQIGFFASEYAIAKDLIAQGVGAGLDAQDDAQTDALVIERIEPGQTRVLSLVDLSIVATTPDAQAPKMTSADLALKAGSMRAIEDSYERQNAKRMSIKRCSKCILPATMPFILFDSDGVCNYCKSHQSMAPKPFAQTEEIAEGFRKSRKTPFDCIVAFSGGRDSSYSMHVLAKELDLNMLAYTYDWGMVTDIARRNQSLMCAELGIEHIWVSADIRTKRANIKRNVEAWMKKPHLGMIPLFMAGDKQYFKYAIETMKRTDIGEMVIGTNPLEKTDFKTGYAGVRPKNLSNSGVPSDEPIYSLGGTGNLRLPTYYATQALKNPAYLNRSLGDTISAYSSYYMIKHPFTNIFDYVPWIEEDVDDVLINQNGWETAPDTKSTWRIGDGTAPFYNYIYHQVAGFSEFDTFRSNQIREGQITRETAMAGIEEDNAPRWAAMQEYCSIVNVNFDDAIKRINQIEKIYLQSKFLA
jgi:asparagine synthetase B (glutamine-hydrolysing)